MARKSKQPGGHNPLTAHEVKRLKSSGWGTQSTRLTTASHLPFGRCCLGLSIIKDGDAVATPSGHVYSREAIVQYLIAKNGELRRRRVEYDRLRLEVEERRGVYEENERTKRRDVFAMKDQGAMMIASSSTALVVREEEAGVVAAPTSHSSRGSRSAGTGRVENSLTQVSYWLASSQPTLRGAVDCGTDGVFDYARAIESLPSPPPDRPASPMSGETLRLKQLIPLHLVHEGGSGSENSSTDVGSGNGRRVVCAVSQKTITTQPTIAIKNTGQVMLKSVYEELALPTMTCPITGRKFKEKDVLELVQGRSGYAASGEVVAKKYNPTLT